MNAPVFESRYRDKLWRIELSEYGGKRRVSVWSHYQDSASGEWKPCGGKGNAPGFIVPSDRADELAETLAALAAQLRTKAA